MRFVIVLVYIGYGFKIFNPKGFAKTKKWESQRFIISYAPIPSIFIYHCYRLIKIIKYKSETNIPTDS